MKTVPVLAALVLIAALAPSVAAAPPVLAKGKFGPTEQYTGKGTVTIVRVASGRELRLSRDFVAMNAIRLRLYLATSPAATTRIDLGAIKPAGAQRKKVPARVNLKRFRYVIAWCVAADAPITQAVLR